MNHAANYRVWATGLALFSMFFGAGNVIFPLLLGVQTKDQAFFAILGIWLTAVLIPITGVVGALLFRGELETFFSRMGRIPGLCLMGLILCLLGPFGALPRCIALSYSTFAYIFPSCPLWAFSLVACGLLYLLCFAKSRLTTLLGYVLTPMLLLSIIWLIVQGLFQLPVLETAGMSQSSAFWTGLKQGYQTLDLIAAFFFSAIILEGVRFVKEAPTLRSLKPLFLSCAIAAALLGLIYAGLCFVAAGHLDHTVAKDQLMAALSFKIMGREGGLVAVMTVVLACLTTAVSLAAIFSTYVSKWSKERINYKSALVLTLATSYAFSLLKFDGIVAFIAPILEVCYPALLILTFLNIAYKMGDFRPVKTPVSLALFYGVVTYVSR